MIRKCPLVTNEYYHVFNKSIAGFRIFNNGNEYNKMMHTILYYQIQDPGCSFAQFTRHAEIPTQELKQYFISLASEGEKLVEILAYCLMPTHVHFILRQRMERGISIFMGNILNSYARYFNVKYKRFGPLWASRFKAVLIEDIEQMSHLTRYIHLNPTTANLGYNPEDWLYSSYREYLGEIEQGQCISLRENIIDMTSQDYRKFVEDQIDYQKNLAVIRRQIFE